MLKSKIVTLGAAAVMGVTSLGVPQVIAHADTTKSGNTVVSYTGTAPQPKDWGISVPATVNLSENSTGTTVLKYGNAKLAIVNADGTTDFTDTSANHKFTISGQSQYVNNGGGFGPFLMYLNDPDTPSIQDNFLYAYPLSQGVTPTSDVTWTSEADANPTRIQNLEIDSNTTNNTPTERYVQFAANKEKAGTQTLSDTISWTASETTPAS